MAQRSLLGLLVAALLAGLPQTLALRATPNSPCANLCIDSNHHNQTDPNSFSTVGDDIVCENGDFNTKPEGEKFQQCVSCLQGSTYSAYGGNDQAWFVYNLQYSVDYCVFGYPNASHAVNSPCMTSEACSPLQSTLEIGILNPDPTQPYLYCGGEASALSGQDFDQCLGCVQAEQDTSYLANFLIALKAGCLQQPTSKTMLGLNETVFSTTPVDIVNPTPTAAPGAGNSRNTRMVHFVLIGIGAFVFLLMSIACVYMQIRRRKNRTARAARAQRVRKSLLFGQTRSSPRMDRSPQDDESMSSLGEKPVVHPAEMLHGTHSGDSTPDWGEDNHKTTSIKLSNITTVLPRPPPVQASPLRHSPDDYATPGSTTSLRSNAPLLNNGHKPYQPSEYTNSPSLSSPLGSNPVYTPGIAITTPQNFVSSYTPGLAVTTPNGMSSPQIYPSGFTHSRPETVPAWEDQHLRGSGRAITPRGRLGGAGAPTEMRPIQTSFPPPPSRR